MKILAAVFTVMLTACATQPKPATAEFKQMYKVLCVTANNTRFAAVNVYEAVNKHSAEAHWMEITVDNGTIYHYLLPGETCGVQTQDSP